MSKSYRRSKSKKRRDDEAYEPEKEIMPLKDVPIVNYIEEVGLMMFAFGDAYKPNPHSVKIVEDFVRRHISTLMHKIAVLSSKRGEKSVSLSSVLLVYQQYPDKLKRLQQSLKYILPHILRINEYRKREGIIYNDELLKKYRKYNYIFSVGEFDFQNDKELKDLKQVIPTNNLFLSTNLFKNQAQEKEELKHKTLLSKNMTSAEYSMYMQCCDINFLSQKRKGELLSTIQKFCKWIGYSSCAMPYVKPAMELLGRIAYETVGLVTQIALIVQKNMKMSIHDRFEVSKGIESGIVPLDTRKQFSTISYTGIKSKNVLNNTFMMRNPVKPVHIVEAIRRMSNSHNFPCIGKIHLQKNVTQFF